MLKITEIFFSLQGEARDAGRPTVFIRLTGCPLRCTYCDSEYAFFGGEWMHFDDILAETARHPARHVCVTGGEPLAQKRCLQLLEQLCDAGYAVSLETSGAIDVSPVDERVSRVVDLKTPDSGEADRNLWSNLGTLGPHDQLKFVICSRGDYEWAREQITGRSLADLCEVLVSPAWGQQDPTQLAEWVLADGLPVRMQLQLHKLLWGDEPGK
ncbi:7-carboxy-7-deazaguanine synthase QueE [Marinihelvus fidelis]|uniref:7-carboxy-7-deazaguanine synthase n=1 Tax=Marinihelvus fidelis TaxID=2613842 RepID=A0A5N0TGL5_9GAMM|nr:7-carboxy-7-deazaguanine synthase QueE [Marinihelvus fidelis]KAA9133598.1 7-carboxy-7-deazaguanine synthase QueE [Marinihelvus fidelis]